MYSLLSSALSYGGYKIYIKKFQIARVCNTQSFEISVHYRTKSKMPFITPSNEMARNSIQNVSVW